MRWAAALVVVAACSDDDPWVGTFSGTLTEGAAQREVRIAVERCDRFGSFHLAIDWAGDAVLDAFVGNDTTHVLPNPNSRTPWSGGLDLVGAHLTGSLVLGVPQDFDGVRTMSMSPAALCPVPID